MLLKPFDFGILIPALGMVLASFVFAYSGADTRYTVHLRGGAVSGSEWVFPQGAVETVTVAGPLGDTVVEIQNGAARILSSPCANQTCVAAGLIHSRGQWTACLPNKVMVFIGDEAQNPSAQGSETDVDAAAW